MRISSHAKVRMRERTSLNHSERKKLFRYALTNGKSPHDIENGKFKSYLDSRTKRCKIKVYQDYIFIYSKNNHRLITIYEIPNEFKEVK